MGPGTCFKKYDLHTVTIDELKVRELHKGAAAGAGLVSIV
jgi:hypothetical protein